MPDKSDEDRCALEAHEADLELVRAVEEGDSRAARLLVERLLQRVRTLVKFLVHNDPDGDDLVQLAMLEILKSAPSFRGESRLETWADRVAVRTAMRAFKRQKQRKEILLSRHGEQPELVELGAQDRIEADREEEVGRQRVRERLQGLIACLPSKQSLVVTLRLVHEYGLEEIAEMTGARLNTVRGRLRTGMKRLRRSILRDPVLKDWVPPSRCESSKSSKSSESSESKKPRSRKQS